MDRLSVEDKLAKAIIKLRAIRPFYSAIYESLEKIESDAIGTIGVSTNKLIYCRDFIDELPFEEFMFITLHECAHVALLHSARLQKKDKILYNKACDLYVNKLLSEEFNILPGQTNEQYNIKFPYSGQFTNSLDTDKDYVEAIYEELVKQGKQNGYFEKKTGSYYFTYKGSGYGAPWEDTISLESNDSDLVDNGKDPIEQEFEAKKVVNDAKTKYEMLNKGIGTNSDRLKLLVDEMLKSKVDWRKLLRRYCIKATSSDTSFMSPDKRMYYQNAIYPGQSQDVSNTIKGIKVCFDVSGSISEEELGQFYYQVYDILKKFNVQAELICWNTEITTTGDFKTFEDFKNFEIEGSGGTNQNCIFEYFDSKKCKIKPIVTLIFTDGYIPNIKTDKLSAWKRKYKDTIWILSKNSIKDFKPEFGVKANVIYDV